MRYMLLTTLLLALATVGAAQGPPPAGAKAGPWLGLTLPGNTGKAAVMVGGRPPRPVAVLAGEAAEFSAAALKADVQTIVQFARESRATKEVGSGQMWGRIAGFPSSDKTVEWAADQFRKAGITDVRIQPIAQNASSALWLPLAWQVKLLADPAFGPGSSDLVLESALPVGPSDIRGGSMTAPLIYVGAASPAVLSHIDVKGKIAVQLVVPQGHMLFERGAVGVTNNSPLLQSLIDDGPARYGVNFISERSTFQSGEAGGWSTLNVAKVCVMQAPPLYHTTGEVLDVISTPGLERIARFLAFFVSAVDRAPQERINP